MVIAVIGMGRSLNLRVIAEGAETQEELAFLKSHQCDEAQGHVFSRAVPAEQFAHLLQHGLPVPSAMPQVIEHLRPLSGQRCRSEAHHLQGCKDGAL